MISKEESLIETNNETRQIELILLQLQIKLLDTNKYVYLRKMRAGRGLTV